MQKIKHLVKNKKTLGIILIVFMLGGKVAYGQEYNVDDNINKWIEENYSHAIDSAFNYEDNIYRNLYGSRINWYFNARILPSWETELEFQLIIYESNMLGTRAIITMPYNGSIRHQLKQIYKEKSLCDVKDLPNYISIVRDTFNIEEFPEIACYIDQLKKIRLETILPNKLIVDGYHYEIISKTAFNEMYIKIGGPPGKVKSSYDLLLRWIEKFKKYLILNHANRRKKQVDSIDP